VICLADTHVLIWSFLAPENLSQNIKSALENEKNIILYSPVSLWEIAIKYGLGKLELDGGTPEDFFAELHNSFFQRCELNDEDIVSSYHLPLHHRDPFDRLLIWEAIRNDFVLLSVDGKMKLYKDDGLKFIA
jgi:PIN domain nuclease of toxin-antitoxin system